eukprot:GHUV01034585.1.p1 GENE.GHUV01034585.1~~GHUV01034585.1.p1  ORF type:complete len:404 (+),score=96.46 GHUV01034585.1:190-1401(+)
MMPSGLKTQLVHMLLLIVFVASSLCLEVVAHSSHTSNWAVLVATSKYWYNYRHIANTLSFYRTVKRLGIPDSNIILMLAEDIACNSRNAYPSQVFNDESHKLDLYGSIVEVDYRGYGVTVENFIRVLTGRHDPAVPRNQRMLSDRGSNVLVYISGHGGNEFMKFQDTQELMAQDVADAIQQMYEKGRYRELLLVVETCQAATLYSKIRSPNVIAMASSLKGESSYSYLTDTDVGLSLIDRFTWQTLDFFEKVDIHSNMTLADLFSIYRYEVMDSHFHYDVSNYNKPLGQVPITSFFGSVSRVQQTPELRSTVGNATCIRDCAPEAATVAAAASTQDITSNMATGTAPRAAVKAGSRAGHAPTTAAGVAVGPVRSELGGVVDSGVYIGLVVLMFVVGLASTLKR